MYFVPGSWFSYASMGFTFMQSAVDAATGERLETTMQRLVFGPLGMRSSSHEWQDRFLTNIAFARLRQMLGPVRKPTFPNPFHAIARRCTRGALRNIRRSLNDLIRKLAKLGCYAETHIGAASLQISKEAASISPHPAIALPCEWHLHHRSDPSSTRGRTATPCNQRSKAAISSPSTRSA
jgi:CubicO group peptidase (beta-lactamase class C family)